MSTVPLRLCGSMDGRTLKKKEGRDPAGRPSHRYRYSTRLCTYSLHYATDWEAASNSQINERGQDEEEELHSARFVFRRQHQLEPATTLDRVGYRIAEKRRQFSGSGFSMSGEAKLAKGARVSQLLPEE